MWNLGDGLSLTTPRPSAGLGEGGNGMRTSSAPSLVGLGGLSGGGCAAGRRAQAHALTVIRRHVLCSRVYTQQPPDVVITTAVNIRSSVFESHSDVAGHVGQGRRCMVCVIKGAAR